MKKGVCYLSLFFCCTAFAPKGKKDVLQKVKVIRLSSLSSSPIADFHCQDFYDSCGHYQNNITNPAMLKKLEAYKQSARKELFNDKLYEFKHPDVADGKLYYYYKSGKVDSMCFSGDYVSLNGVSMAVPTGKHFDLYYILDSSSAFR